MYSVAIAKYRELINHARWLENDDCAALSNSLKHSFKVRDEADRLKRQTIEQAAACGIDLTEEFRLALLTE